MLRRGPRDRAVPARRPPPSQARAAPALDLGAWILWQDDVLLAVDKPAGVLSQAAAGAGPSLVDLARAYWRSRGVGVLHRLDRNVSGIVLLARDPRAARGLSAAFARGEVEREYTAVARGTIASDAIVVDAPLVKDPRRNVVRVAPEDPEALAARTEVRVERRFSAPLGRCAVLAVRPITGRPHQIRVHLAAIGLPIVGDPKYGVPARGVRRPLLHARRIAFVHPLSGERVQVASRVPWSDEALATLRRPSG